MTKKIKQMAIVGTLAMSGVLFTASAQAATFGYTFYYGWFNVYYSPWYGVTSPGI